MNNCQRLKSYKLYIKTENNDIAQILDLKAAGTMDSQLVRGGQWWRVFTAVTLHADAGHLASNLVTGVLLLGLAMGGYGPGKALLASFLAGVVGNLAGLVLLPGAYRSLGASGMVLGALGLLTVQSFSLWRSGESHRRLIIRAIAAGLLLLVLLGMNPHTDVLAHVGGFAGGCILGIALVFLPDKWKENVATDRRAALVCLGVIWGMWVRALM